MNRGPKPKRRLQAAFLSLLMVGVIGGTVVGAREYFQADTTISATPKATVTKVLGAETNLKNFEAGPITLSLPKDWEEFVAPDTANATRSWRNTLKNKGVQVVTAYVDSLPPTPKALNRVLAVESAGDRIQQLGSVSDNCTDFVDGGRQPSVGTGKVSARWNGVQFVCDNANYLLNVVGIASKDSVNGVTLVGPSGSHKVFLTFTDANVSPKNDILMSAVESLRVR